MGEIFEKCPALAASLEQGNIISGPEVRGDTLYVNIGFDDTAKVFLDYLKDGQILKRLKRDYSRAFSCCRIPCQIELCLIRGKGEN